MNLRRFAVTLAAAAGLAVAVLAARANDMTDVELAATTTAGSVTNTAKAFNGWLEAIQADLSATMTGTLVVAVQPAQSNMAAYTVLTASGISADAWSFPTNGVGKRFATRLTDTISAVWSSATTNKAVRTVIRIETTDTQRP